MYYLHVHTQCLYVNALTVFGDPMFIQLERNSEACPRAKPYQFLQFEADQVLNLGSLVLCNEEP